MEKIILLLILLSSSNKDKSKGLVNINEYINNIEIDYEYTEDKIHLAKKLAPLMPSEYINPINRSIYITENLVRIMELKDYMDYTTRFVQTAHVPIEDNRERMTRIVSVIQEEIPKSNTKNLGTILELIVNMDRYKKMFDLFNTFMKNQNVSKDVDSLARIAGPMMKGKTASEGEGSLDIEKIMNIISILNKPKDKVEEKDQKISTESIREKKEAFEEKEIDLEGKNKINSNTEIDYEEGIKNTKNLHEKEKPKEN
ncbi:MAG: hypothetical protein GX053_07890 [Tissierella sp.]|nr:hypothetical protein [Tissierella sp.]